MTVIAVQYTVSRVEKSIRSPLLVGTVGEVVDSMISQVIGLGAGETFTITPTKKAYILTPAGGPIKADMAFDTGTIEDVPLSGLLVLPGGVEITLKNSLVPIQGDTAKIKVELVYG